MTRYEIVQKIEQDNFYLTLFNKGIISCKIFEYKVYYEQFMMWKGKGHSNAEAYTYTADEYMVSENTIRNAVKFMTN